MQMNFSGASASERKVIRTWQLRVATFYGALCVVLLLLSLLGDRTAPTMATATSSTPFEAVAAR